MPDPWIIGSIIATTAVIAFALSRPRLIRWSTNGASARSLAVSRILVTGAALLFVLYAPLSSVTLITDTPEHTSYLFNSAGILDPMFEAEWFISFVTNETYLSLFRALTLVALLFALIGYKTRFFLAGSFLLFLVYLGILHHTFGFFHKGLLPLHLLAVLIFTPCADAFSVDARMSRFARDSHTYQIAQYVLWLCIALAYLAAGVSKLSNAGIQWMTPDNLRGWIHISDHLNPESLLYAFSLHLVTFPDAVFLSAGAGIVLLQLLFPLVLFSRYVRMVFPALAALMHLTIYLLFDFVFFDMILLQGMFYVLSVQKISGTGTVREEASIATRSQRLYASILIFCIVLMYAASVAYSARHFPFSAWSVYSGESYYHIRGVFIRPRVYQMHTDGGRVETSFNVLQEQLNLYYFPYSACYYSIDMQTLSYYTYRGYSECDAFLKKAAERLNTRIYQNNPISAFEIRIWEWSRADLLRPDYRNHGSLSGTFRFSVGHER